MFSGFLGVHVLLLVAGVGAAVAALAIAPKTAEKYN